MGSLVDEALKSLDFGSAFRGLQDAILSSSAMASAFASRSRPDVPTVRSDSTASEKQKALESLLSSMVLASQAPDERTTAKLGGFFSNLYANGFRHKYSGISGVLFKEVGGDETGSTWGDCALADNIAQIVDALRASGTDPFVIASVEKLHDHVKAETDRMVHISAQTAQLNKKNAELQASIEAREDKIKDLEEAIAQKQEAVDKFEKKLDASKRKAKSMERQYISILAIFAAVVLVFNGAVSLSSSAVGATAGHHPFAVGFVVLLVGFVLFNCLAALFTFLRASTKDEGEPTWGAAAGALFLAVDAVLVIALIAMFFVIKDAYWL